MKLHPDLEKYVSVGHFNGMVSCPFVFGFIRDNKSVAVINTNYSYIKSYFEENLKNGNFLGAISIIESWWYIELLEMYTFTEQQVKVLLERSWKHLMDPKFHHHSVDPRWIEILKKYPQTFFLSEEYLKSEKYQEDIEWFYSKIAVQNVSR